MREHQLARQLEEWNGRDALRLQDNAWLNAIAIPLVGHRTSVWKLPWEKVCLISDGGWSAWITTFGNLDPAQVGAGSLRLQRGRPCRNGVWKSFILNSAASRSHPFMSDPQRAEICGQMTSLHCSEKVTLENPYCGEGDDVFVVSARLRQHRPIPKQRPAHCIGYKELEGYLWWAQLSQRCSHGSRASEKIKLGMDCATVAGFGNYLEDTTERILIFQTAHSIGARWLALAALPWLSVSGDDESELHGCRQILLRGDDCCLQCAIDQAAAHRGEWFIIS